VKRREQSAERGAGYGLKGLKFITFAGGKVKNER